MLPSAPALIRQWLANALAARYLGKTMEHRQLGASGFKVPVLSLGTGTFGGQGSFKGFGKSDAAEATRLVAICLDAGLTMFDSADAYSAGMAEKILRQAIKGRREKVIISTKSAFRIGPGPNDVGSSRYHLILAVQGSRKRLVPAFKPNAWLNLDCSPPVRKSIWWASAWKFVTATDGVQQANTGR